MKTNKNLRKDIYPCPVCRKDLDIRISKKQKPYCVCQDCGVQLFIRGKRGVSRFSQMTGFKREVFSGLSALDLQWVEKRLSELKAELRDVERKIEEDFWEDYPELRKKREEILWEIKMLGG